MYYSMYSPSYCLHKLDSTARDKQNINDSQDYMCILFFLFVWLQKTILKRVNNFMERWAEILVYFYSKTVHSQEALHFQPP